MFHHDVESKHLESKDSITTFLAGDYFCKHELFQDYTRKDFIFSTSSTKITIAVAWQIT